MFLQSRMTLIFNILLFLSGIILAITSFYFEDQNLMQAAAMTLFGGLLLFLARIASLLFGKSD